MVYKLYRIASKVATLNTFLKHAERKIFLNTFHKARSNSTAAWPPAKLLKKYQQFQLEDNVPTYLKGGVGDRIFFGTTLALIAVGLADGLCTLVTMAFPKKKN